MNKPWQTLWAGAALALSLCATHNASAQILIGQTAGFSGQVAAGACELFTWHPDRIPAVADYVAATIRQRYPDLNVPYHSRWRHFEAGGVDR